MTERSSTFSLWRQRRELRKQIRWAERVIASVAEQLPGWTPEIPITIGGRLYLLTKKLPQNQEEASDGD